MYPSATMWLCHEHNWQIVIIKGGDFNEADDLPVKYKREYLYAYLFKSLVIAPSRFGVSLGLQKSTE